LYPNLREKRDKHEKRDEGDPKVDFTSSGGTSGVFIKAYTSKQGKRRFQKPGSIRYRKLGTSKNKSNTDLRY